MCAGTSTSTSSNQPNATLVEHEWLSHEIDASLEEREMGGRIRKEGGWGVGEPTVSKATKATLQTPKQVNFLLLFLGWVGRGGEHFVVVEMGKHPGRPHPSLHPYIKPWLLTCCHSICTGAGFHTEGGALEYSPPPQLDSPPPPPPKILKFSMM